MSNAIEDPRVRAAIEHYLLDLENTQPKNTKRNYRPKQEEWKEWCQANWPAIPDVWPASVPQGQQLPGDLVDEGKLLLFMKEKTTPRGSGSQEGRERRRAPSDTIVVGGGGSEYESDSDLELYESTLKLQYNTVRGYVSAIQKLYDEQKSREVNPAARPQGVALKALKRSILATTWSRKRKEYMDRGVGTLRDVYAGADTRPHQRGMVRGEIACALRTQVDFLLGNHMLLRSGNRLPMELADCFPDLPNEGFKAQGRKGGKVSVFQRSEDWYETKVLRRSAKEPQAPLSGQTAREWTSRFYKKAGIKVSKVSHAPRVAATQNADMAGVDEGQIRRAGRWNNGDQMTGCYLTSLPFEFMRAVADFDPEWSGSYFVPGPPSPFSDLGVEQNMAAGAFLELLEWLREVLLQDAVFLRESYPDHPIFQDPVSLAPSLKRSPAKFKTHAHGTTKTAIPRSFKKRSRWLRRSCAHWMSLRRPPTPSPSAPAKVLQVNMRRSRELINRGARSTRDGPQVRDRPFASGRSDIRSALLEQQQEWCKRARGKPPEERMASRLGRANLRASSPRSVKSVQELLRLWRQGWGEMPSVDSLERDWGARWRPSAEKNYLSTRKIIVDEVRRRAQSDGLTEDIVARQMDEERGPSSLDKLFKAIRKDRQGEKGHKRASGQFNVGGSEKSMAQ
ncbi:centromere DNA-binding protein complex CBF3 subunit [Hirsutella rhossiliensis]|uniref:Centromere DNA-binding protein complex CBF3 subunit n=1 Tax=Hirsutella rhossiliensis TaxID=111463 RepID=A0A9P8MMP7_9HYPO|nr:centromere DNA-binding protein complex CBF3 subunit [Hirsutella rhossiliensis]KAH0957802.1 centromere DNA-binding protein complex CBF3 subunit [Hirsutella rhossiliensis]